MVMQKPKKLDLATGNHFKKPGHSIATMQITLLEKNKTHSLEKRGKRF